MNFVESHKAGRISLNQARGYAFKYLEKNPQYVVYLFNEGIITQAEARPFALTRKLRAIQVVECHDRGILTLDETKELVLSFLLADSDHAKELRDYVGYLTRDQALEVVALIWPASRVPFRELFEARLISQEEADVYASAALIFNSTNGWWGTTPLFESVPDYLAKGWISPDCAKDLALRDISSTSSHNDSRGRNDLLLTYWKAAIISDTDAMTLLRGDFWKFTPVAFDNELITMEEARELLSNREIDCTTYLSSLFDLLIFSPKEREADLLRIAERRNNYAGNYHVFVWLLNYLDKEVVKGYLKSSQEARELCFNMIVAESILNETDKTELAEFICQNHFAWAFEHRRSCNPYRWDVLMPYLSAAMVSSECVRVLESDNTNWYHYYIEGCIDLATAHKYAKMLLTGDNAADLYKRGFVTLAEAREVVATEKVSFAVVLILLEAGILTPAEARDRVVNGLDFFNPVEIHTLLTHGAITSEEAAKYTLRHIKRYPNDCPYAYDLKLLTMFQIRPIALKHIARRKEYPFSPLFRQALENPYPSDALNALAKSGVDVETMIDPELRHLLDSLK